MIPSTILFDLDDTLIPEEVGLDVAFRSTVEPLGLSESAALDMVATVRATARWLYRQSPLWGMGRALGIASSELLWTGFGPTVPALSEFEDFVPWFRRQVWSRSLAGAGIEDQETVRTLSDRFIGERVKGFVLYHGARELLVDLRGTHKLGLITNGPPTLQRTKIERAGISDLLDVIVISGETGLGKPDPRAFQTALSTLGSYPQQSVMVGDSAANDVQGAQGAGLRAIWVSHGRPRPNGLATAAVIPELMDLTSVLAIGR